MPLCLFFVFFLRHDLNYYTLVMICYDFYLFFTCSVALIAYLITLCERSKFDVCNDNTVRVLC